MKKARDERNKKNEQKCKKYAIKYRQKVEYLESKVDIYQKKISQKKDKSSSNGKASQKQGVEQQPQTGPHPQPQPGPVQQPQILKLPYPVLNDKRDKATIYRTLETKLNEVMKKQNINRANIESLMRQSKMAPSLVARASLQTQLDKLRQTDASYDSQRDKLIKQLDYIRLSLNLGNCF